MATFTTDEGKISQSYQGDLGKPRTAESALEEIQTETFYNTLKSYYSYRERDDKFLSMDAVDLLDYFYEDRTWRNNNTISMGVDMTQVFGEDAESQDRLAEYAYIQQVYQALPSFWNDPNRNFSEWLTDMGGALLADPINLIGVGVGGQVSKVAFTQTLKAALKGRAAGELNKRVITEAAKEANKKALGQAVKKGALTEGFIGATINGGQDAILQNTAIKAGIQDEFSLTQTAISSGAGFGFGTAFGAGFSFGAFKLKNRSMKNKAIKGLEDLHVYGKSNVSGQQLFTHLGIGAEVKPKIGKDGKKVRVTKEQDIKNIQKEFGLTGRTVAERIRNLRKEGIYADDKPPKLKINVNKYDGKGGYVRYLKQKVVGMSDTNLSKKETVESMIERASKVGFNPEQLRETAKKMADSPKHRDQFIYIIAHGDSIAKELEDIGRLANETNRVNISKKDLDLLHQELNARDRGLDELLRVQREITKAPAKALRAAQIMKDATRAAELKARPEDPKMKALKEGNPIEYWNAVGKLDDIDQIHLALQNARKVNKWDLAAEYVNNNLLSSPDTHILNLISGLTQTHWKPFTMLLRAANMSVNDTKRARAIAREALQTYIYQYVYLGHALKRSYKSFIQGSPLLDSVQLKYDSNIRQGQLQRWIEAYGEIGTNKLPYIGSALQKYVVKPVALTTTLPMRVLSAGDEFLKTLAFKSRMAAEVNSRILDETADYDLSRGMIKEMVGGLSDSNLVNFNAAYRKRFKEIEAEYIDANGRAIQIGDRVEDQLNSPLHYAREFSYTQPAAQVNPVTNERYGGFTGWLLGQTSKPRMKWLRAAGLHFINTPSNLLRWTFQHLPFAGRFQFQMRHMLAEVGGVEANTKMKTFTKPFRALYGRLTGKPIQYVNPEAAAEANARIQMGYLLWGTAIHFALQGKFTGGGDRDYRINQSKEATTGWQPYSYVTNDGQYVSLNRLDPIFMPFFIAADMIENLNKHLGTFESLPDGLEKDYTELAMGTIATLTRNVTSKFYTKNILEFANLIMSDDAMKARAPDRVMSAVASRGFFKIVPLSGGLRYTSRIQDEWERDLFTLSDRLSTLDAGQWFTKRESLMPKRNMLGEKIDRKTGWLFGLGGETGLWSTPFAMTQWKNDKIAKFIRDRRFDYLAPPKTDRYVKDSLGNGVDLRTIKDSNGQTAYDYWLEQKTKIKIPYNGKEYNLKGYLEALIEDPESDLYNIKDKVVVRGKDLQAQFILDIVRKVENAAYWKMMEHFPELEKEYEIQLGEMANAYKNNGKKRAKSDLDIILGN